MGLTPDSNPYRYVTNQPTGATDPSGNDVVLIRGARPGARVCSGLLPENKRRRGVRRRGAKECRRDHKRIKGVGSL